MDRAPARCTGGHGFHPGNHALSHPRAMLISSLLTTTKCCIGLPRQPNIDHRPSQLLSRVSYCDDPHIILHSSNIFIWSFIYSLAFFTFFGYITNSRAPSWFDRSVGRALQLVMGWNPVQAWIYSQDLFISQLLESCVNNCADQSVISTLFCRLNQTDYTYVCRCQATGRFDRLVHSFIHSLTHSLTHSFIHSFIYSVYIATSSARIIHIFYCGLFSTTLE